MPYVKKYLFKGHNILLSFLPLQKFNFNVLMKTQQEKLYNYYEHVPEKLLWHHQLFQF